MSISRKSATAVLLAWEQDSGKKLPTPIKNASKSHVEIDAAIPAVSARRAACERDLEVAKRTTGTDDIRELAAQVKKGTAPEDLKLAAESVAVAAQALAEAERIEQGIKRGAIAAGNTVGDFARSSRKLLSDIEATWRDEIIHDLDRNENSYRVIADADQLADRLAARVYEVLVVLDEPSGKWQSSLLRNAVAARPPALPRLAPLLKAIEDEKRGRVKEADAAQARSLAMRAEADGRAVTGRLELSDEDRKAIAKTAAMRSGHVKEGVSN